MTDPREKIEQPDIVERLRSVGHLDYQLMTEAATEIERLRKENFDLRGIVSESASSIGNGACVAPQCSIEFMQGVPREIAGYTERLRQELAEARERNLIANERADNAVADLEKARAKALEEAAAIADRQNVAEDWALDDLGDLSSSATARQIAADIRALLAELDGTESEGR